MFFTKKNQSLTQNKKTEIFPSFLHGKMLQNALLKKSKNLVEISQPSTDVKVFVSDKDVLKSLELLKQEISKCREGKQTILELFNNDSSKLLLKKLIHAFNENSELKTEIINELGEAIGLLWFFEDGKTCFNLMSKLGLDETKTTMIGESKFTNIQSILFLIGEYPKNHQKTTKYIDDRSRSLIKETKSNMIERAKKLNLRSLKKVKVHSYILISTYHLLKESFSSEEPSLYWINGRFVDSKPKYNNNQSSNVSIQQQIGMLTIASLVKKNEIKKKTLSKTLEKIDSTKNSKDLMFLSREIKSLAQEKNKKLFESFDKILKESKNDDETIKYCLSVYLEIIFAAETDTMETVLDRSITDIENLFLTKTRSAKNENSKKVFNKKEDQIVEFLKSLKSS